MGAFEDIVRANPDLGKVVGYPTGDGDYTAVIPCSTCGSLSLLLFDDRVECSVCFKFLADIEVKAEAFAQAMDAIGELVRVAEGSAKAELHTLALLWQVTVARWVLATEPTRD